MTGVLVLEQQLGVFTPTATPPVNSALFWGFDLALLTDKGTLGVSEKDAALGDAIPGPPEKVPEPPQAPGSDPELVRFLVALPSRE